MKKIVLLVFAMMLSGACSGCGNSASLSEESPFEESSFKESSYEVNTYSYASASVVEGSVTDKSISVAITYTGKHSAGTGTFYRIETYQNGKWCELSYNGEENIDFSEELYSIENNEIRVMDYTFSHLYGTLYKGTYRIIVKITVSQEAESDFAERENMEYYLAAPFTVED